jgi:hypothetical protein
MCTELGPAQCYSADPVGFKQPGIFRPCAARQRVEPALFRPCCSDLASAPPLPAPRVAAAPRAPHAIGRVALAHHASLFIPLLLYSAHCRTPATESTAAPLRTVTPHPKPTTALPTDPSNSTTDHSSGRSSTTPLRPSCRDHLHTHRCLRSSSIPATTS